MSSGSYLPPLPVEALDPDAKAWYDELTTDKDMAALSSLVTTRAPDATLLGPFGINMHSPPLGRLITQAGRHLATLPGLSLKAREIAILVTGTHYDAAYENYAHERVGAFAGLSARQIAIIRAGGKPADLAEDEGVAYDVARRLNEGRGAVGGEVYRRGEEVLGQRGMFALVNYVGLYSWVSVALNGFGARVPEGWDLLGSGDAAL